MVIAVSVPNPVIKKYMKILVVMGLVGFDIKYAMMYSLRNAELAIFLIYLTPSLSTVANGIWQLMK
jgi:hypothetical protein